MGQKTSSSLKFSKYILFSSFIFFFGSHTYIPPSFSTEISNSFLTKVDQNKIENFTFRYDLTKIAGKCVLPKKLREISALAFDLQTQDLISVNDEHPDIYTLNIKQCELKESIDFGKKGDYEGIEIVGQVIYILKSNGHIYSYDLKTQKAMDTYKTSLNKKNDVEGLALDPNRNELILACKGASQIKKPKKSKYTKSFYAFDLHKKELNKTPKFSITDKALIQFFEQSPYQKGSKKSRKKFLRRLKSFSPSAIALHPSDGHFYILSSVGKTLIVVDHSGKIKAAQFLNPKSFSQPEGICFSPSGKMFISNEGRSGLANILSFDYK